jgi:hypothetical protein
MNILGMNSMNKMYSTLKFNFSSIKLLAEHKGIKLIHRGNINHYKILK